MAIVNKSQSQKFEHPHGEHIYVLLEETKHKTKNYNVAYADVLPNCATKMHYHPVIEECYYIIKGEGEMILDGKSQIVGPGDCIAIAANVHHKIINTGKDTLEFVVFCAPGWTPDCSVFLE